LDNVMMRSDLRATTRFAWQPLLAILAAFPIAGFCGAFVTDVVYWRTANVMWADFSDWLLAVGMFFGVLSAIAGVASAIVTRRRGGAWPAWQLFVGGALVLVVGFLDNLVHSRDAWTSVVPLGLVLSALNVAVILLTAWSSSGFSYATRRDVVPYREVRP